MKRRDHTAAGIGFLIACFAIALAIYVMVRERPPSPPDPSASPIEALQENATELWDAEQDGGEANAPASEELPAQAADGAAEQGGDDTGEASADNSPPRTMSIFRGNQSRSEDETNNKPTRQDFMVACMDYSEQQEGGFGSGVDRAFAQALCECRYAELPEGEGLSRPNYLQAGARCRRAMAEDEEAFLQRYYQSGPSD